MGEILNIGDDRDGIFIQVLQGSQVVRLNFRAEAGSFVAALQTAFQQGLNRTLWLVYETAELSYAVSFDPNGSKPIFVNHRDPQGPDIKPESLRKTIATGQSIYMNDKGLAVNDD